MVAQGPLGSGRRFLDLSCSKASGLGYVLNSLCGELLSVKQGCQQSLPHRLVTQQ